MDIRKIGQETEKLNLSADQKDAILNLIDLKINNDMEKVLTKIDGMNVKFDGINTKFDGINTKFDGINTKFDGVKSEVATLKWLIGGIGFTLAAAAIIALIKYVFFT